MWSLYNINKALQVINPISKNHEAMQSYPIEKLATLGIVIQHIAIADPPTKVTRSGHVSSKQFNFHAYRVQNGIAHRRDAIVQVLHSRDL